MKKTDLFWDLSDLFPKASLIFEGRSPIIIALDPYYDMSQMITSQLI